MKKLNITAFCILILTQLAISAKAETIKYISDELSTWLRSGPGDEFRLMGKVSSGEKVTVRQINGQSRYAQITDSQDRTAWIPTSDLSDKPSLRIQVPELQRQVKMLSDKLANIDSSWNQRTAEMQSKVAGSDEVINQLKEENQKLKDQLTVAQKKVDAAKIQIVDKHRAIIMQWFMYGGGVLGFGLILGLVLPHMIPRRKNNRWMN